MCFNGGTSSFGFEIYPNDLLTNLGHYTPFFAGLLIGLIVQIAQKKVLAAATVNYINEVDVKHKKIYKIVNICAIVLICCLVGLTSTCGIIASTRTNYSVNIYCDNEDYNVSYNYNINDSYSNLYFSSIYYNWLNNIDLEQKSEYVCEIFTDANKTIHMDNFRTNGNCNYLTLSNEFVALSRPTDFNFYITISKAFKVQNNTNYCVYKLHEENSIAEDNAKIHNLDYSITNKVKAGDTYKFKVELYRNYDINKLKVYNNGVELNLDSNGYYVVNNVSEDILITYNYVQ